MDCGHPPRHVAKATSAKVIPLDVEAGKSHPSKSLDSETLPDDSPDSQSDIGRIFIHALRPIAAGEELNYDYGLVIDEPLTDELKADYACHCGAPECRGTLLASAAEEKPRRKRAAKKGKAQ